MNPDELLAQIRTLLEAYLDMGEDTPVAAEAKALAGAIDATAGAAPEAGMEGAPPPDMGAMGAEMGGALPMGAEPPPELPPVEEAPPESYSGGSFDEARSGAKDFLTKKKKPKAA